MEDIIAIESSVRKVQELLVGLSSQIREVMHDRDRYRDEVAGLQQEIAEVRNRNAELERERRLITDIQADMAEVEGLNTRLQERFALLQQAWSRSDTPAVEAILREFR